MRTWHLLAVATAILFGTHNLLVKRAAGRMPDAWGAFVLEAVAAVVILVAIGALALAGRTPPVPRDAGAVAVVAAAGVLLGAGSVLYFWIFRLGAPLSSAVPWVLNGWVVVVALLGALTEGEPLGWRHAGGLAAAALALWLLR
jgi:drug/metabolite transporter (DMT)-like permease